MSYSFQVSGSNKAEAVERVKAELAKVVESQPYHNAEKQAVQTATEALIGVLTDPAESEVVGVSISGSLSWRNEGVFTSVNVSIGAYLTTVRPKSE